MSDGTFSTMNVSNAKIMYECEYGTPWPLNDQVVQRVINDFSAYDAKILVAEMHKEVGRSYQGGQ